MDILPSFSLMKRKRKIKAKTIGPPRGQPKRLTFKSGSAFFECKRQAPLRESQAFSPSLGRPLPRVLAVARAPNPDELWRTKEMRKPLEDRGISLRYLSKDTRRIDFTANPVYWLTTPQNYNFSINPQGEGRKTISFKGL